MITEIEGAIADCWVEGPVKTNGLYLLRFENCGRHWYFLYECWFDEEYNQMLYIDHIGGNKRLKLNGNLTHHCLATTKNFGKILGSMHLILKLKDMRE